MTFVLLGAIGILAGILSGFVGIGGGLIIVPALVYIMGFSQYEAQGTSLFLMLPPVGIFAVMNYWKADSINITYGVLMAITFVLGGYLGSKLVLKLNPGWPKIVVGALSLYVGVKMILGGYKALFP